MSRLAARSRRGIRIVQVATSLLVWYGSSINSVVMGQLPISLSDFPRKVRRQLPDLQPSRQITLGPVTLHPSLEMSVQYDDNITLKDNDPDDDVILVQVPSLIGEMSFGDHRLEIGYGAELLEFAKNREENAVNHLAHGIMELNFSDLQLTLSDTFEESTNRVVSETSARNHVWLNTASAVARYDRPNWAAETGWVHNTVDHRTSQFEPNDYNEDVWSVLGGYKVWPKTLVLLETGIGIVNYDQNTTNADQDYWQVLTGVRGELTPKITTTLKIGFQDRQMGDVPGQGPQADFDGVVAEADLQCKLSERDSVRARYLRTPVPSTFGTNNWYRQDRVTLSARKRFARKWILQPSVGWQMSSYPELATVSGQTKRRRDHFGQAGLGLRYEIQEWVSAGVGYQFRTRNSNLDTFDFNNNRFTVDVTVAL